MCHYSFENLLQNGLLKLIPQSLKPILKTEQTFYNSILRKYVNIKINIISFQSIQIKLRKNNETIHI